MGCFEIIIVTLLLRIPMHKAKGTEDVFIVTNKDCITNSTSAIAFNPSIESINESEDTSSNFYPRQKKKYICNIEPEEENECVNEYTSSGRWKLINSLDGEVTDGVLDRRWEELRIYKSKHLENDGETLSYKKIDIKITKKNFVIPFSVRLKNEGHIFLCQSEVSNSKCYWIMLQAWKGTHSAIRRCDAGAISNQNNKWPEGPCQTPRSFFNHTEDIISDSFWAHFKITFDNGNITVYRSNEQSQLLGFKDEKSFLPRRIYVHSKKQDGLWKFHNYTYLHTTKEATSPMGDQFNSNNKCIAFFIVMCENCALNIQMTNTATSQVYFKKSYTTWNEKWKEIKIDFKSNETNIMYVTTTLRSRQKYVINAFWAIDSIRHCEDKEYRILTTSIERAPCQLIENKNSILTTEIDIVSDQNTNCPENTFGKKCIPCAAIGDDLCSSLKYCELFDDKRSCHCTSGYHSNSCRHVCPWKYYGHGCKKQCDNCLYGCNNIDGNCNFGGCTDGYKGIRCDEPAATWLEYAPEVTDITETSCLVYIAKYEVIGDRNSINYIRIQYKKNISTDWSSLPRKHFLSIQSIYDNIDNLEADTTYCVRAQLYSNTSYIYEGSVIKERCFNTTCIPFSTKDIHISTYNTSATIELPKKSIYSCQINNYKYRLDEGEEQDMNEIVTLFDLKPFQNYTFNLRHGTGIEISKEFQTTEGVPSKVKNLKIESSSSTSIFLKWEKPSETNGRVIYNVRYKMQKINCSFTDSNSINVTETEIHLPNVKPYSKYEIEVGAQTRQAAGEYWPINMTTNTDSLKVLEFPKIAVMDEFINNVTIKIIPPNCENADGPIYMNFVANCSSCDQQIHHNITVPYIPSVYRISELHPYTEYILFVSVSRNATNDWTKIKTVHFKTKPSVPHKIEKLEIVSKDENSVSLRWKPPFPPTGILDLYKIDYNGEEIETKITECSLWPKYHCATIENMKGNKEYNIKLFAKNQEPNEYKQIAELSDVITKTEVPHRPYDVITTWTDRNDLNISWKHPNVTNGKVKNFTINIKADENQHFLKEIKSVEDYNLTYSFLIQKENFRRPCSIYTVSVTIYNEKFNKESHTITERSPPPVPHISNNTIKITNDTNHTIFIEISKPEDDDQSVNYNTTFYILTSIENENINSDIKSFEEYLRNNSRLQKFDNLKLFDNNTQKGLPYEKKIDIDKLDDKVKRLYIYFVNECDGKVEIEKIEKNPFSDPESTNKGIYALILLILLVPLIALIYMYKIKKKQAGERSFMSIIKPQRKKDIDEVPLSENEPTKSITPTKSSAKQAAILPVFATYVLKTKFSKPIKINDFEIYVKQAIETGELEKQHENFPRGQTKPWEYGSMKANKAKNRYNNLIAYDHTRVKLAKIDGNEYSDYINANYIDGYRVQKAYIATQGPKSTTLNDFWRMIWQENVRNIVMLANITEGGKKKVEKYWPSINEETDFNGIRVQYLSSKVYANYEYRVFKVHKKNEQREVNQLHFTSWPDHGVPLYSQSLVPFLQQMLKIPHNPQSPVVVHCSAGVGRTGTIILCDICLRMAAGEGSIDFLANLEHLRSQRANMVDNVEQYKLAHLVVLECLFGMHTSVPCDENMNKAIKKILSGDSIANQLRYLSDTEWEDRAMDTVWSRNDAPIYPEKNRFKDITPDKNYQISLRCYPYTDESSSYINAVQVDGFRSPGRYIVTQQPLPNTVGDFWRMVWERQCTVIISLNEIDPKEKSSCRFWPKKGSEMTPVDYLNINCVNNKVLETYQITTIEIINRKENESMQVKIVAMRNWMPDELLPSSIENYFLFWEECDILSRKSDTVIVTCYDGATASGLYIASTFLIDKMKLEQECDVCLAIRTIRHNRKQFVTNEEQFKFLYRAALMFIEGFQSYANFS